MSFVQVMSHSGGGLAADRTPFYGIKLPPEAKSLVQLSKKMEHATLRKVLKCKSDAMKARKPVTRRETKHTDCSVLELERNGRVGHVRVCLFVSRCGAVHRDRGRR